MESDKSGLVQGIDKTVAHVYYLRQSHIGSPMAQKYEIGQKVRIRPAKPEQLTPRDADIAGYAGRSGQINDYYWITLSRGEIFYVYSVQVGDKEIVLHEDEIEPHIE
jgi:hypothetical protein